jgi:hypothetical protein
MADTIPANNPKAGPAIGALHEVDAVFDDSGRMDAAVNRLLLTGFQRADLSLPEPDAPVERSTPESGAEPAYTEDDAVGARTLHTSGVASVAGLLAAGLVVGTGGVAAAAFGAALGAAALAGGATFAVARLSDTQEQSMRDVRAAEGRLLLAVRTPDAAQRAQAESILRECGAVEIRAV